MYNYFSNERLKSIKQAKESSLIIQEKVKALKKCIYALN